MQKKHILCIRLGRLFFQPFNHACEILLNLQFLR